MPGLPVALRRLGLIAFATLATSAASMQAPDDPPPFRLEPCQVEGVAETLRCGTFHVFENRAANTGRRLPLRVIVIPAAEPRPGLPSLYLAFGGPGQTASENAARIANGWQRRFHEVVLVDQRGTGDGHRLDCQVGGSDEDLQAYLEPLFEIGPFRACRDALARRFDLGQYSTANAADDLDDIRRALGHERILLTGGSYGSRFILTYIRRHGAHVGAAAMMGLAPYSLRNPLYHARGAQQAWDGLVAECLADRVCSDAYPDVQRSFDTVRARLRAAPATVAYRHPATGATTMLRLSEEAFGEAVRVMMYNGGRARRLPLLLDRALDGDLAPFAEAGLAANRQLRDQLRLGMLLSVVCSEDVARIRSGDIERETRGTFLGDTRVRQQMAICAEWPASALPADHAAPFRSDVPVLLVTGNLDPVTPPVWGEAMGRFFSRARHLVVPAGHDASSPCMASIMQAFLLRAALDGLDTSCAERLRAPPFLLPDGGRRALR